MTTPAEQLNIDEEFKAYLLDQTRAAILRLKVQVNELTGVGVALKAGVITTEQAIADLHRFGLLTHITGRHS